MDCRGDPWFMWIFGWLSQNPPFYYYYWQKGRVKYVNDPAYTGAAPDTDPKAWRHSIPIILMEPYTNRATIKHALSQDKTHRYGVHIRTERTGPTAPAATR